MQYKVDASQQLQAVLSTCLPDGEGLQKCLEWNGHASMRPCFRHCNVYKKGSGMKDAALGYVDITCSNPARLRRWSAERWLENIDEVLAARRRFQRKEINKTALAAVIKSSGYRVTKHGYLADMQLRLHADWLHTWRYDWMHTALQDGFMSNAMFLICKHISRIKYGDSACASFTAYLKGCQFPVSKSAVGRLLKSLFEPAMMKKHMSRNTFVANASSQFTLYTLLKDWSIVEAESTPALHRHVAVYLAACAVLDQFKRIKHRMIVLLTRSRT